MHKGLMLCGVALLAAVTGLQAQDSDRKFQDLVGTNRDKGDARMRDRGFKSAREEARGGSRFSYWTHDNDCIEVEIRDNRYSHVTRVEQKNCRVVVVEERDRDKGRGRGNDRVVAINYPRVKVDTDGRGSFTSRKYPSAKVVRGFVDTRSGQPSVSFRVDNQVVTFNGNITRSYSEREFEFAITGSSEGSANGTARFRLNPDGNEVEMISVQGNLNGQRFNGSFNR